MAIIGNYSVSCIHYCPFFLCGGKIAQDFITLLFTSDYCEKRKVVHKTYGVWHYKTLSSTLNINNFVFLNPVKYCCSNDPWFVICLKIIVFLILNWCTWREGFQEQDTADQCLVTEMSRFFWDFLEDGSLWQLCLIVVWVEEKSVSYHK